MHNHHKLTRFIVIEGKGNVNIIADPRKRKFQHVQAKDLINFSAFQAWNFFW